MLNGKPMFSWIGALYALPRGLDSHFQRFWFAFCCFEFVYSSRLTEEGNLSISEAMAEFVQPELQNDNPSGVELSSVSVECLPEQNRSGVQRPPEQNQQGEEPLSDSVEHPPQQNQPGVERPTDIVRHLFGQINESAAAYPSTNQSRKSISQVAFCFFAASLSLLLAMVEGLDKQRNVGLDDTISFKVFIVTGVWALLCSLVVSVITVVDPHMPEKITRSILMAAAACFLLALLAAGYIVKIAVVKWIAVSSNAEDHFKFKSEVLIWVWHCNLGGFTGSYNRLDTNRFKF